MTDGSFRLLFASNPLPMFVYDLPTLAFLEVNDAAIAYYGYARDEFLGMRVTDIRPPEDIPRAEKTVAELAQSQDESVRRYDKSWRHRLKDGRIRDVDVTSHPLEFGGHRARLVIVTDVTELKQAEASLARSTERLAILHEIDRSIIAAETPEAMAASVLPRLRDLLQVPRAIVNLFDFDKGAVEWLAAAGRRRVRVGPGVRYSLELSGDLSALRRGEPQLLDVDALPPGPDVDGLRASGVRWYTVVPMITAGELIGSLSFGGPSSVFPPEQVAIAQDIATQLAIGITQARLYARVSRQAEELEARVNERTLQLSEAKADADRANRAKSEFLSRMSHELRTPLNGIIGFAQLLELDDLSVDQRESVTHILKGGRHLLTLINEVLDIARIEAGRLSISLEPVLVGDAIRSALDLVRPQAAAHGIALPDGIAGPTYVMADRQRLQQVLLNLLANAVKYNRDGGKVMVSAAEDVTGRVRIAVSDTGRGIAPAMLDRLFTPFDRLGADALGVEGTGLGLALSKRLVEAMAGTIVAESRPGEGSTFTIDLPSANPPVEILADAARATGDDRDTSTRGTVLYIEDNLANIRLLERIVSRRPGITLLSAIQGRRGIELARDHRPRLILLDLHLPDVSGREVLARLREDPQTRDIPVVILSADATPNQTAKLLAEGARAYLTKPVDVAEVLSLLDKSFSDMGG